MLANYKQRKTITLKSKRASAKSSSRPLKSPIKQLKAKNSNSSNLEVVETNVNIGNAN
jgi:hypothetical protein